METWNFKEIFHLGNVGLTDIAIFGQKSHSSRLRSYIKFSNWQLIIVTHRKPAVIIDFNGITPGFSQRSSLVLDFSKLRKDNNKNNKKPSYRWQTARRV